MDQKELVANLRYACRLCDRTFMYPEVMNMHKDAMHSTQTKVESMNRNTSVNKNRESDKLACPHTNCHVTCSHLKSLAKHIRAAHEPIEINGKVRKAINRSEMCPHCGKTLGVNSLRAHIKHLHTGEMRLCSKCPFNTKRLDTLKKHVRLKHTSWKQSCEFCGKVVKDLKTHLRATMCGKDVDNRKTIPCPKCPKLVRNKSKLKQHIHQIHDGVRDKICNECLYTTYSSCNLRLHMSNVHDKTPMFKECPRCHTRTGNLNKHLEIYHIEETQIED